VNALLIQMGVTESDQFLRRAAARADHGDGVRDLALLPAVVPLHPRADAVDRPDMYEAADVDGASPFQKFRYLSLPMLMGILSVLFLLRFIWTFNKFDDIFLLTGGNAGDAHADGECLRAGLRAVEYRRGRGGGGGDPVVSAGLQLVLLPLHVEGGGAVSGSAKLMIAPVERSSEQRAEPRDGGFAQPVRLSVCVARAPRALPRTYFWKDEGDPS
jgi:hypothetical protein